MNGRGELLERVGQDDHLRLRTELVEEVAGARHRLERRDDLLDLGEPETVLGEQVEPVAHQDVVVGLVAGRAEESVDAGGLGHRHPHLGDQHTFEVEGDDRLRRFDVGGHVVIVA